MHMRFCVLIAFQSTLSRGERLAGGALGMWSANISIHALTRRAANSVLSTPFRRGISIHALTRRAASFSTANDTARKNFNPRSHEESGPRQTAKCKSNRQFQSTLSRGERHVITFLLFKDISFQSTLSRGERPRI